MLKSKSNLSSHIPFLQYYQLSFQRLANSIYPDSTNYLAFKTGLSGEDQIEVLKVLNESSAEELLRYKIPQNRIKNIEIWKNKRGLFKSLSDVIEVYGLGEKLLEQTCKQIIENRDKLKHSQTESPKTDTLPKKLKQLTSPPLEKNIVSELDSATGIHLSPAGVGWARLNSSQSALTNWNYKNFTALPTKMSTIDTFNLAVDIVREMPPSDIYVFGGNASLSPQAQKQAVSYFHQVELSSMLVALLNTSIKHNVSLQNKEKLHLIENRIYYVKTNLPARLFKLMVGTETTSAQQTVNELLQKGSYQSCKLISLDSFRQLFDDQSPTNKELLGQALLLIISFIDICIYQNPSNLSTLFSNNRK